MRRNPDGILGQTKSGALLGGFIEVIPTECGKSWIVEQEFTVRASKGSITVKKWFKHDRYTFAPNLKKNVPAIVHDWLCSDISGHKTDGGIVLSRKEVDAILLELMLDCGYYCLAYTYYVGVRIFSLVIGEYVTFKEPHFE